MKTTCSNCIFATYKIGSDETKTQNGCRFNRLDKFEKSLVYDSPTHKESFELSGFCNACRQIEPTNLNDISIEQALEIVSQEIKPKIDIIITDDFEDIKDIEEIIAQIPKNLYNKVIISRKNADKDLIDLCEDNTTCSYYFGDSAYDYQYLDEAIRHSNGDYLLFISSTEIPDLNFLYSKVDDLVNNKMCNFSLIHNPGTIHGCLLVKSIYRISGTFANKDLTELINIGDNENKGILEWEQVN